MAKKRKRKKTVVTYQNKKIKSVPPCHIGFTEIIPHLFLGKLADITPGFVRNIDVLVPLDSLLGKVWDYDWRGEILYIPITDYRTLPKDLEKRFVERIIKKIQEGKDVAIFCLGGHGRTGYMASLVLGKLGFSDPIEYIRKNYCKNAVESSRQIESIAEFLDNPEILDKYYEETIFNNYYYDDWCNYFDYNSDDSVKKDKYCKDCGHCSSSDLHSVYGYCEVYNRVVDRYDYKCKSFVDIIEY